MVRIEHLHSPKSALVKDCEHEFLGKLRYTNQNAPQRLTENVLLRLDLNFSMRLGELDEKAILSSVIARIRNSAPLREN